MRQERSQAIESCLLKPAPQLQAAAQLHSVAVHREGGPANHVNAGVPHQRMPNDDVHDLRACEHEVPLAQVAGQSADEPSPRKHSTHTCIASRGTGPGWPAASAARGVRSTRAAGWIVTLQKERKEEQASGPPRARP